MYQHNAQRLAEVNPRVNPRRAAGRKNTKDRREVRAKIRKDKEECLENVCAKITDANMERKPKKLFDQIKKVKKSSSKNNSSQCSINDKNGKTLIEKVDVLGRWHEFGSGLFDNQCSAEYMDFETGACSTAGRSISSYRTTKKW